MINKMKSSKLIFFIINSMAFIIFLWINIKTPLLGDDFIYQKICGTEVRTTNLYDVLQSQINHYQMWGGRSVVHFIDQAFLLIDKGWFNVTNTVVFLLFAILIYYYSIGKKVSNIFLLSEYILLWCTIPCPVDTIVMQTDSVNYLWGSTLILLYLLPYFKLPECSGEKSNSIFSLLQTIIMFFCGVLCGWTIEAGAVMLLTSIFTILVYQIKKKKRIKAWEISGFIGTLVGFCIMILAPGNYKRADVVKQMTPDRSLLGEVFFRIARETYYMLINMWPLFAILVVLVIYGRKRKIEFSIEKILFFIGVAFVGVYAMTASPAYAVRVLVTPIAFVMIALGKMYDQVILSS